VIQHWRGEADCNSLGRFVDLGPDADGDGLADVLVVDWGCADFLEDENPDIGTYVGTVEGGFVAVLSSASGGEIYRWEHDIGQYETHGFLEAAFGPDADADSVRDIYILVYANRVTRIECRSSASGELVYEREFADGAPVDAPARTLGYDIDGDGNLDGLGYTTELALLLSSNWELPVSNGPDYGAPTTSIAGRAPFHVLPDANADGSADVVILESGSERFALLNGADGSSILEREVEGRFGLAISRPYDVDGDGVADLAYLDGDVTVFLSAGID